MNHATCVLHVLKYSTVLSAAKYYWTHLSGTPSVTSMMAWLQFTPISATALLSCSRLKATVSAEVKLAMSAVFTSFTAS